MSEQTPQNPPAQPLEDDHSFIGMVKREWPQVRRLLFHIMCFAAGIAAAALCYDKFIIPGKDATIQAKDSVIQSKDSEISAKEKAVESIQQTVNAKDDLIFSLTNQFHKMMVFQEQLSTTQTNIVEQQKKLEDVEYLVRNIFEKTVAEQFSGSDSNRCVVVNDWGDVQEVMFLLSNRPIVNSIHGIMSGGGMIAQAPILPITKTVGNLAFAKFKGTKAREMDFSLYYVKDTRDTNLIRRLELRGTNIFLDGQLVTFK